MKPIETERLEDLLERKIKRRLRKRKPRMRVQGAGLRDLARRLARKK